MAGWTLLGAAVALALSVAVLYHGLVEVRTRIGSAWAQVDVQLRRRHEIIPDLVDTVQGRLTSERFAHHDTVFRYNAKVESFPALLVARPLQFRAGEYFTADDTSQGPVRVDF